MTGCGGAPSARTARWSFTGSGRARETAAVGGEAGAASRGVCPALTREPSGCGVVAGARASSSRDRCASGKPAKYHGGVDGVAGSTDPSWAGVASRAGAAAEASARGSVATRGDLGSDAGVVAVGGADGGAVPAGDGVAAADAGERARRLRLGAGCVAAG